VNESAGTDKSGPAAGDTPRCWRFGEVRLDESSLKLEVRGRLVELERKPLEVLLHLLRQAGKVVTKDDLIKAIWPGRILSDSALTSTVAKLREALGDEGDAIKTVHGFGYRFEAAVRATVGDAAIAAAPIEAGQPTRRLAAIMFTDLVGYSALAHRDEALAIELLELHRKWIREILPRHGGTEIETVGDAFLISFAGALAAVECAVAIQQRFVDHNAAAPEARRMQLRIGIHLGDVEHKDGKVMGDGVNIASRIHGMAEPGGICVSEHVYHAVHNRVGLPFANLGRPALKNIATPFDLFALGTAKGPVSRWSGRRHLAPAIAALLLLAAGAAWLLRNERASSQQLGAGPIAILPCDNLSGDAGLDLLAEGIAEEVSSRLARIPELSIVGRASSRAIKKTGTDALAIGKQLNARAVLTCSVRRRDAGVRLSAQLVGIPGGVEAWSTILDRQPDGASDAASEIALSVADAALPRLVGEQRARLIRHNTRSNDALEAYLRALVGIDVWTEASTQAAIDELETAVRLDPEFALAYTQLAFAYDSLLAFQSTRKRELEDKVMALASKAVLLDPSLADARAMVAYAKENYFMDWAGARKEFEHALRLGPNSVFANTLASDYFIGVGPFDRAVHHAELASKLDPANLNARNNLLKSLVEARQFDRCLAEADQAIALHSGLWYFHLRRGECLIGQGQYAAGLAAVQKALELVTPPPLFLRCDLAYAHAMAGDRLEAERILADLRLASRGADPDFAPLYVVHAGLRDRKAALAALEDGFKNREWIAYWAYHRFYFDFMRGDAEFIALGRKYGLKRDGTLLEPGS
jgi:adenylate cyclase